LLAWHLVLITVPVIDVAHNKVSFISQGMANKGYQLMIVGMCYG